MTEKQATWRDWWKNARFRRGVYVGVVLLGIGGWYGLKPAPLVETVHARVRDVVELVIASGRIRSKEVSSLGPEITGVVDKLLVEEGDTVKRNQKLAELSNTDLYYRIQQSQLGVKTAERQLTQVRRGPTADDIAQAKAELELAKSRLRQANREKKQHEQLFRSNTVSQADYDRMVSNAEQARASMLSAKARLERLIKSPLIEDVAVAQARLREARAAWRTLLEQSKKRYLLSPFEGVIVERKAAVGQVIPAGAPLFVLASHRDVEIFAETDENNLSKLQVGQTAIVVAGAYKTRSFEAVLDKISPMIDHQRGVVGLRFNAVKLPPYALLNMSVDVNIRVQEWKQALSLPLESVVKIDGKDYVMVINKNRIQRKFIQIRGKNADWVVCQGIEPKDVVVLHGNRYREGQKVRTRPSSRSLLRR